MAFQTFLYYFSLRSGCIIIGLFGLFINIECAYSFAPNDIIESIIFIDFVANVLLIGGAAMHKRFCVLISIAINIMFNVIFWLFVWLVIRRSDSVSIGIVLLEHIAIIHMIFIKIMCDYFDELQKRFAQSHSCVQRKYCFDIRCCDCKINYNLRLEVFTNAHYDKWQWRWVIIHIEYKCICGLCSKRRKIVKFVNRNNDSNHLIYLFIYCYEN